MLIQDVFTENCVAVVFVILIILSLVLPKNMDIEKIIYNIRNSKGYIIPKLYCNDGEIYISDGYVMNGSEYKGDISESDIKGIKWLNGDADRKPDQEGRSSSDSRTHKAVWCVS